MLGGSAAHALEGESEDLAHAPPGPSQPSLEQDGAAGICTNDCLREGQVTICCRVPGNRASLGGECRRALSPPPTPSWPELARGFSLLGVF